VQRWPGVCTGVQMPALQKEPAAHCTSVVQSPRQAVAPQMYGSHSTGSVVAQLPVPSQKACSTAMLVAGSQAAS
jgi:hypothetical protein